MIRPPPPPPKPALLKSRRAPFVSIEIDVVTPLVGGGANPGRVDRSTPVRGSAVRGQLRFWWRACHAARYAEPAALFDDESRVWGAASVAGRASGPSAVEVTVTTIAPGAVRSYQDLAGGNLTLAYLLFPFRPNPQPLELALEGVRFRLDLTVAPHVPAAESAFVEQQARDALWAWVTFGGLGARTRRGCGSLGVGDRSSPDYDWLRPRAPFDGWLAEGVGRHASRMGGQVPIPLLDGAVALVGQRRGRPRDAWIWLNGLWRSFRQPQRGQRHWPEGASVLTALGLSSGPSSHSSYPRADLGLPIVFERLVKDPRIGTPELRVTGDRVSRMASPVVLKPLVVGRDEAVPLALVLNAPHLASLGSEGAAVELHWREGERRLPRSVPVKDLPGGARTEFLDHAGGSGAWAPRRTLVGRP